MSNIIKQVIHGLQKSTQQTIAQNTPALTNAVAQSQGEQIESTVSRLFQKATKYTSRKTAESPRSVSPRHELPDSGRGGTISDKFSDEKMPF